MKDRSSSTGIHQLRALFNAKSENDDSQEDKEKTDFACSETIKNIKHGDFIEYFGSTKNAIKYYQNTLESGFPRSAAFLMERIVRGAIDKGGDKAVENLLVEDLSGLTAPKMAIAPELLITKIAEPSAKRKIMFSSAYWLTGGMERVMSTLFKELKNDFEIYLITPYVKEASSIEIPDYVTHIKINSSLFESHFDSLILSYALLFDINVVVGYMNMFNKQLNLYRICRGTDIKTIASNHEYYFYPYKSAPHYNVVEKRINAFKECTAVVWPNNFSAALCALYVNNSYVIGNPNGFAVLPQQDVGTKEKVIICVGRFNDYVKRIDRILKCFSIVAKKVPDAKLILVGQYDKYMGLSDGGNVKELINELGIPSSSIEFKGEVDNVQQYYSKARVLMLTSNSEGFGMVVNEAACFGVPSVANYMPGIEDIIVDSNNGFVIAQDDITSMAQKVVDVLVDDGLHQRLSINALKQVANFDSKHIGDKWRYLINSVIDDKDEQKLHKQLQEKLGYKKIDSQVFSKILSDELNEVFYMSLNESNRHRAFDKAITISKMIRLPGRIRASVRREGLLSTGKKIVSRTYIVSRNLLK